MSTHQKFADYDHPDIQALARQLTNKESTVDGKMEKLFYFVRDEIKFAFHPEVDALTASEILHRRSGQCNNKSTLLLALIKAIGLEARIHFSTVNRNIHRGLWWSWMYPLVPERISHSWIEVLVDGTWRQIDAYINDKHLQIAGRSEIRQRGWEMGFSVAEVGEAEDDTFSLETIQFQQMGAVQDDHGIWDDPAAYYDSELYHNRLNPLRKLIYTQWTKSANQRLERLRQGVYEDTCNGGLCYMPLSLSGSN